MPQIIEAAEGFSRGIHQVRFVSVNKRNDTPVELGRYLEPEYPVSPDMITAWEVIDRVNPPQEADIFLLEPKITGPRFWKPRTSYGDWRLRKLSELEAKKRVLRDYLDFELWIAGLWWYMEFYADAVVSFVNYGVVHRIRTGIAHRCRSGQIRQNKDAIHALLQREINALLFAAGFSTWEIEQHAVPEFVVLNEGPNDTES